MAARSPPTSWPATADSGPRYGTCPSMPSGTSLSSQHVVLEVAVLGVGLPALPVAHGAERAHAPVELVLLAVDEDHLARAFLAPGEQAAQHDGVRARGDGLGDVARVLQAAVADDRNPGR